MVANADPQTGVIRASLLVNNPNREGHMIRILVVEDTPSHLADAVRVGESLDVITRERTDVVAPGAVTVRGRK